MKDFLNFLNHLLYTLMTALSASQPNFKSICMLLNISQCYFMM